ncbi:tetratricopeptide repeat protein [Brevibacillus borstelensis]|uniref:tetratricopeptide repeat protein n=1 Tax=Brevibacillus borstelensis TaxID=45462 RepID=UPI00203B3640|nr:tetratricopeptide repeat protein [Brevibacillus borstelensis]MCM3469468.1 tetratricopeptide repeat protein [Brevibacillus borstelensis]MCM3590871.1 tetratricopeptide repeat protein [Brevibacillus borstelensis]MCM3620878.1 tetratricopeptide repeat protein [Brevibacillus borstelensis]MED1851015.1 tetratricopeptide repeat protein [Brevibacillus borstelensis]
MTKQWLYVIDEAIKRIENDEVELGLQALQKVQEHGKDLPEVMLYLAEVWYRLGHLDEAAELLAEVMKANPELDPPLRRECQLLLAEIGLDGNDFEAAQHILYELKESGYENLRLDLLLTDLYAMQGLDEVAIKYLEQARQKEPDNKEILTALGNMYFQIGKDDEAMKALEQAGEQSVELLLSKSRVLAQNGDFEQAYHLYQHALEQEQSAEILYGCALMAFHTGNVEEAADYVGRLLALDEEYVAGYPLAADIFLSMGKTEKSIEALEQYVELSGFDLDQIRRLVALLTQSGRYEDAKEYQKLLDAWNVDEE